MKSIILTDKTTARIRPDITFTQNKFTAHISIGMSKIKGQRYSANNTAQIEHKNITDRQKQNIQT
jgi:hypothetical protein